MTDTPAIELETLYVTDREIVRRLGLPVNSGRRKAWTTSRRLSRFKALFILVHFGRAGA